MKKIFTLSILFSSLVAVSQPTINSNWFPPVGSTITSAFFNATTVSEGPAGANQAWNFAVTPNGTTFTNSFVSPASTPYFSSFPGSNLSITGISTGGAPFYSYFNHTSSLTELKGLAFTDVSSGLLIEFYYTNGQINVVYPTTYNTTFTDNFSGSYSVVYQGITVVNNRIGTVTSVVDGYGSLTTPTGNYNNVLRMKINQITYDTTTYIGVPIDPAATTSKITTYNWVGSNTGEYGLAQISYDTVTNDVGSPPSYNKSGYYQSSASVGVNEISLKETIKSYPNPARDFTKINVSSLESGDALLQVFDASGRLMKNQIVAIGGGNDKYLILHIEDLKAGFYQMNILQNEKILNTKFIKQ